MTPRLIQAFVNTLGECGLAPRTIRMMHGALRACLKVAVEQKALPLNPALGIRLPRQEMRFFNQAEALKFIAAAEAGLDRELMADLEKPLAPPSALTCTQSGPTREARSQLQRERSPNLRLPDRPLDNLARCGYFAGRSRFLAHSPLRSFPQMPQFPYATTQPGLTSTIQQLRSVFPPKVTADTLKKWNIAANNESSILQTLRFIGVVDEEGTKQPNAGPVFVLDDTEFPAAFGELVKRGYASLFELYGDTAWQLDKGKLTGFFRTSDQTSARVGEQQAATFMALASLAGHAPGSGNGNGSTPRNRPARRLSGETRVKPEAKRATQTTARPQVELTPPPGRSGSGLTMSVRIELNLPISDKQEVYDNIFRSIRENLINANV